MYKKYLKLFLAVFMTLCCIRPLTAYAMNVYITPDKYEAEVGERITYTVTVEDGVGTINIDGEEVDVDGVSTEFTYERSYSAVNEYRFEVFADGQSVDYVVVKIVEEGTLEDSDNNNNETDNNTNPDDNDDPVTGVEVKLSSLVVKKENGEEINLDFSSEKTTYSINVTDEEEVLTIDAKAFDEDNVKIQGLGTKTLLPGENVFEIIVEDKTNTTKKTYTINVFVKVLPVTHLNFNNKQYGIMAELTNVSAPAGFKKTKTTINKENVEVYTNNDVILVYGIDDNENGEFYIYREDDGMIAKFNPLTIGDSTIYLIDVPSDIQEREAMSFETIQVSNQTIKAWVFDDSKLLDYVLIYALNSEGVEDYLVLDAKNQVIYEYPESEPTTYEEFEEWLNQEEKEKPNYVLYGSIGAVVLAIVGVIIWMVSKNKKEDEIEEEETTVEGTKEFTFNKEPQAKVITTPKVETEDEQENEDEEWLTDHFYKTIMGDDDE